MSGVRRLADYSGARHRLAPSFRGAKMKQAGRGPFCPTVSRTETDPALSRDGLRAFAAFERCPRAAWRLIRSRVPLAEPEGSLACVFGFKGWNSVTGLSSKFKDHNGPHSLVFFVIFTIFHVSIKLVMGIYNTINLVPDIIKIRFKFLYHFRSGFFPIV